MIVNYRMNAGYIPGDHWVHGPHGGGRNIGEACHIYDLFNALTGSQPVDVQAMTIVPASGRVSESKADIDESGTSPVGGCGSTAATCVCVFEASGLEVGLGDGSGGGEDTDEVVVSAGGGGGGMTSLAAGGVADAVDRCEESPVCPDCFDRRCRT